ncbi:helix-turn-helix transcriptional regulator [Paenibacillus mucilaginosus]|uniref:AraC family transcriptional regulator n=2 Tax=Paenibacillus mucilaginosus TaxID=61624 RepID=H6NAT5_9BACL|nr:AraC family transcriptional regulator [Paenibacillus mucilaginosus]AEI42850.1 Transcriptional regulator, AraC [Paenibacillus mucilaginosus KNP414]AFC30561.1 AraC family transcriptional regulator [Paenibacillus mucilaginosus 3016]MCG7216481.1 AraC family transcriptional regulator [Paenibacillus mucilaginosus]WDM31020.1 helix-turn-helix transcriptional regulator [Paenibacillus mucilaginosus]WFA19185.1 AraC family transcriptional regulator [Paenibacillus mucilaginosus]
MEDFHHNFHLFFDEFGLQQQRSYGSEPMTVQPQIGSGTLHRLIPRPDLDIVFEDLTFHSDFLMPLTTKTPMVELHYCMQGTRVLHVERNQYEFVPGMCVLQLVDEGSVQFEFTGNQPYQALSIGIPISTFHHYMEDYSGARNTDFSSLLGRKPFRLFQESIDPAADVIIRRLTQSVQSCRMKNLELESSVLELLWSAFQSFLFEPKLLRLSTMDKQKLQRARDILLERMANPPSLIELSRMIGLNDNKLKMGFKELYGTTVFGYLREKRLEKAFLLLQQGDLNVMETSLTVGYSNPSSFSEAFRDKYGVNPGHLRRRSF